MWKCWVFKTNIHNTKTTPASKEIFGLILTTLFLANNEQGWDGYTYLANSLRRIFSIVNILFECVLGNGDVLVLFVKLWFPQESASVGFARFVSRWTLTTKYRWRKPDCHLATELQQWQKAKSKMPKWMEKQFNRWRSTKEMWSLLFVRSLLFSTLCISKNFYI